ncbi:MAG: Gfo/Idh/MocA family oxidoreductase [Phycisphaeraceae bacterium]|nr:Gfo/Idh/MocA family oxidoreductase [Phycisphaeraceae bacterium]
MDTNSQNASRAMTRRSFLASGGAAALSFSIVKPGAVRGSEANSKIKVGCIGLGGRGRMIADMIHKHGGYHIAAVADYFPNVANAAGDTYRVPKNRRYSGLSGYQKMINDGVDAVFLETPPYCFPDHVEAAVKAGCHVYMAKPVACDVPGCQKILKMSRQAHVKRKVFLVDFQTRTDPYFIEGIKRVQDGLIGPIGMISSEYNDESFSDPAFTANVESRLQHLVWVNDVDLGGSYLVNAGIHAIDVALWIAQGVPVSAMGSSRRMRRNPHGDSHDVYSLTYEFANGMILNHRGEHLKNLHEFRSDCFAQGADGYIETGYTSRVRSLAKSGGYRGGNVENLYRAGAERNIDTFHKSVINSHYDNPTVEPSVNATMATILGREAAARKTKLTWDELLKENKRLDPDLSGLKV